MNIDTAMNQVFILFFILLIGFISRRKGVLNQEINKGLTIFLMNIAIPFTIISSFNQNHSRDVLFTAGTVFFASLCIHFASVLVGFILYFKCKDGTRKVLWFITVFSNCGFMGYPVMESVFGKIGVFYGSVYVAITNVFLWTFGKMLFSGEKDLKDFKKVILNPGIISIFIGAVLLLLPVKPPVVVSKVIDMMGSMTTPMSMIIVGSMLAEIRLREIFSGFHIYYGTMVRLLLMPVMTLMVLKLMGIEGIILGVCVIATAMPAAAQTVIFAERYGADSLLASRCVFLTTVGSILTIPFILLLL